LGRCRRAVLLPALLVGLFVLAGCAFMPGRAGSLSGIPRPFPRGRALAVSGTLVMGDQTQSGAAVAHLGIANPSSAVTPDASGEVTFVGTIETPYELESSGASGTVSVWQPVEGETWTYRVAQCQVTSQTVFVGQAHPTVGSELTLQQALAALEGHAVRVVGTPKGGAIVCRTVTPTTLPEARLPWDWASNPQWRVGMPGTAISDVHFFLADSSTAFSDGGVSVTSDAALQQLRQDWSGLIVATNGQPERQATAKVILTGDAAYARSVDLH